MTQVPAGVVLLIEDDADIRDAIVDVLAEAGHRVGVAAHGGEGLAWLETHPKPAMILLDLTMPVMDGCEFLARLRADRRWDDVPVTLFSATGQLDDRAAALGVVSFLAKPINLDDLLAVVQSQIGVSTPD